MLGCYSRDGLCLPHGTNRIWA